MAASTDALPERARRPRVLVTTWRRQGRIYGPVLRDFHGVEIEYAAAVQAAGATTYLTVAGDNDPVETVTGFDGLVLIGGEDVSSEVSGVNPDMVGSNTSADRDRWEMSLLGAAIGLGLPVLAVCRGMQLLNMWAGGTLHGDVHEWASDHPVVPDERDAALAYRHQVTFKPGSRVAEAYGVETKATNSLHHQAIDRVADSLRVTATSSDGIVEAVELDGAPWCVGVQWHPELAVEDPLERLIFDCFVGQCRGGDSA